MCVCIDRKNKREKKGKARDKILKCLALVVSLFCDSTLHPIVYNISKNMLCAIELCEAGCQPAEAHALVEELCSRASQACTLLNNSAASAKTLPPPIKISTDGAGSDSAGSDTKNQLLLIESNGIVGKVNQSHFEKLCQLWDMTRYYADLPLITTASGENKHAKVGASKHDELDRLVLKRSRDVTILSTLLRYNALSGGSKDGSGGGFQGALHGTCNSKYIHNAHM
jgi:hypothetical protein